MHACAHCICLMASTILRVTVVGCAVQSLEQVRTASGTWEAQAQSGLAQVERLKDLLEETARWSPAGPHPNVNPVRVAEFPTTGAVPSDKTDGAAAAAVAGEKGAAAGPAAASAVSGSAPAEAGLPVAGDAAPATAGAAQAAGEADAKAARQRAKAAEAEAASLRRACAQLEEQLRWQRAAAASAPQQSRMPLGKKP